MSSLERQNVTWSDLQRQIAALDEEYAKLTDRINVLPHLAPLAHGSVNRNPIPYQPYSEDSAAQSLVYLMYPTKPNKKPGINKPKAARSVTARSVTARSAAVRSAAARSAAHDAAAHGAAVAVPMPLLPIKYPISFIETIGPTQRGFKKVTTAQLREICRKNNIPSDGNKKELSDRICSVLGEFGLKQINAIIYNTPPPPSGGKSQKRKAHSHRRKSQRTSR
jgi:hypothetical protein